MQFVYMFSFYFHSSSNYDPQTGKVMTVLALKMAQMPRGGSRICGRGGGGGGGGGGAVATASAAGAKVFGGSRLKTLFGISKRGGGARAPCGPPPPPNPLVMPIGRKPPVNSNSIL